MNNNDTYMEMETHVTKGARVRVAVPFDSEYVVVTWTGACGEQETVELNVRDAKLLGRWLQQAAAANE